MTTTPEAPPAAGIDPDRLATALEVLAELDDLPVDHPDAVAVRLATGRLFKQVKQRRRRERRRRRARPRRSRHRGDRDRRRPAASTTRRAALPLIDAGRRPRWPASCSAPRACYTCKQRYIDVDAFYHQLCPACAALNRTRREARTDLTGRRALLTGGRAKIGMHIALRLLRDGADTTITTRFPARRRAPLHLDARQRRLAAPAARRRHRPARPGAGRRAGRRRRRSAGRSTC